MHIKPNVKIHCTIWEIYEDYV